MIPWTRFWQGPGWAFGFGFHIGQQRYARWCFRAWLTWVLLVAVGARLWGPPTTVAYSRLVLARDGSLLHGWLTPDQKWRLYTPVAEVDPAFIQALIHKEDRWFAWHPGVNPFSLVRAAVQNLVRGRRVSGASTITMQVVRLLRPRPRTWVSKLVECWEALELECLLTKADILHLYVNLLPYGSNIEGVGTACQLFWGHPPARLSPLQVGALLVAPNRPSSFRFGRSSTALTDEARRWVRMLGKHGVFTPEAVRLAETEETHPRFRPLPRQALHFSQWVARLYPDSLRLRTSLDLSIQTRAETIIADYVRSFAEPRGISQATALVADRQTRQVLAYVGSANPADVLTQGQVDGLQAVRSPGSTLKPLLYAVAFDSGHITPQTIVFDIPTHEPGFFPENYDGTFEGSVSVRRALIRSLNIPAVEVLRQTGVPVLTQVLATCGFRQIERDAPRLGLSMILGGCGVRATELAAAFGALANGGQCRPLRVLPDTATQEPSPARLCSPAAAWWVGQALQDLKRPDLPASIAATAPLRPRMAWKTGTSYGKRDAWAVGFDDHLIYLVWLGNFSGTGADALTGADMATPLLFRLAELNPRTPLPRAPAPPSDYTERRVCRQSGLLPDTFCHTTVLDAYLAGVSSTARCTHRSLVWVDDTPTPAHSYCPQCLPPIGVRQRWFDTPPVEEVEFLRGQAHRLQLPPPHNPACTARRHTRHLRILFPLPGATYHLPHSRATLHLRARTPLATRRVSWFIDGRYVGSCPPDETWPWPATSGTHTLTLTDDAGNAHTLTCTVVAPPPE